MSQTKEADFVAALEFAHGMTYRASTKVEDVVQLVRSALMRWDQSVQQERQHSNFLLQSRVPLNEWDER